MFARSGYRDVTIQEICSDAQANIAAVNYHFGSKEKLYRAVWEYLTKAVHEPSHDAVRHGTAPEDRLQQIIAQRVRNAFDDGPGGRLRRLLHREMGNPTQAHADIRNRFLRPLQELLTKAVADFLGRHESDPVVLRCAFSVQSQLVTLARLRMKSHSDAIQRLIGGRHPTPRQLDELTDHFTRFILAGLRGVASTERP